ncbi:protein SPEAR3-like [Musa acuminata AAA Group]|uniref:protein SPEAR3-like n=1 Tax=Musa acuminata AAA Group TaxID=214697 RepID=UPI0031DDDB69
MSLLAGTRHCSRVVLSGEVMESRNYTQKLVLGSERYGSCRRRKKNSDKPKHPQRGPGVAQLEKIILQNQMIATCLSQFDCDLHKHIARVQMRYASSPSSTTTASSSSSSSSLFELHQSIMIEALETQQKWTSNKVHSVLVPQQDAIGVPLLIKQCNLLQHCLP